MPIKAFGIRLLKGILTYYLWLVCPAALRNYCPSSRTRNNDRSPLSLFPGAWYEVMDTEARPDGDVVTLTLRLIRSFEQRNIKFLVLKTVDLNWTTEELIEKTFEEIRKSTSLPKPFKTFQYDSMKVSLILNNAA